MRRSDYIIILFFMCFSSLSVIAQEEPGPDPDVPIDGGISLLLAAGVGVGIKKIRYVVAAQVKK